MITGGVGKSKEENMFYLLVIQLLINIALFVRFYFFNKEVQKVLENHAKSIEYILNNADFEILGHLSSLLYGNQKTILEKDKNESKMQH